MTGALPAALVPAVAVWATFEAVRTAPRALANLRVRRRLTALVGPSSASLSSSGFVGGPAPPPIRSVASRRPRSAVAIRGGRVGRIVEQRRRRARDRAVPDRLDRIVRRLRAGATLPTAIVAIGADDDVFASLAGEVASGRPLVPAVTRWRDAEPMPNRRLAATALELSADAGGASARVLDGVADSLRDRVALDREVAALSSQARASAVLLVVAPVVFTVFSGAIDPRIPATLFGTPVGWACLVIGLALDALGALWMARLLGRHR